MAEGLELYFDDGSLMLGINTYVGMFNGSFTTNGTASGTHTDTALIGRTLLTFLPDTGLNTAYRGPNVSLNSSTGQISWSYAFATNGGAAMPSYPSETIYYGGY